MYRSVILYRYMKKTKKVFREFLNQCYAKSMHKNGRYEQKKRAYGDYLYAQDRVKFECDYEDWLKAV